MIYLVASLLSESAFFAEVAGYFETEELAVQSVCDSPGDLHGISEKGLVLIQVIEEGLRREPIRTDWFKWNSELGIYEPYPTDRGNPVILAYVHGRGKDA